MGYDLCKDCYETPSKVPGRFNQQHTPDHRFERASVRQLLLNLNSIGILVGGPMFIERPDLVGLVGADATAADGRQATLQAETMLALLGRTV